MIVAAAAEAAAVTGALEMGRRVLEQIGTAAAEINGAARDGSGGSEFELRVPAMISAAVAVGLEDTRGVGGGGVSGA